MAANNTLQQTFYITTDDIDRYLCDGNADLRPIEPPNTHGLTFF